MRALSTVIAGLLLLTGTALSAPALAGDGRHGHGWRHHGDDRESWRHDHRGFRHEWSDGRCRYEIKRTRKGWKEERSCRDRPHRSGWDEPRWRDSGWRDSGWSGGHRSPPGFVTWLEPGRTLPPPPPGYDFGEVYRTDAGRFCREYQTEGWIGGRLERLYGTACLTEGGDWTFVR